MAGSVEAGVRGADEEEFRRFVAARSRALLRTAYLLTGSQAGAEDLLQTALGKTYRVWSRLESPAAYEAYVRTTLVRTAANWWRRRRRDAELLAALGATAVASSTDDPLEDRDEMWRQLLLLPVRQRAVLVLRYYEGLSEAEIARMLGCATGTVKSQAHRGLATLRRRFTANDPSTLSRTGDERPA
jgi:RNA polymerase sigma-70 factor (ECF subfamily)